MVAVVIGVEEKCIAVIYGCSIGIGHWEVTSAVILDKIFCQTKLGCLFGTKTQCLIWEQK